MLWSSEIHEFLVSAVAPLGVNEDLIELATLSIRLFRSVKLEDIFEVVVADGGRGRFGLKVVDVIGGRLVSRSDIR